MTVAEYQNFDLQEAESRSVWVAPMDNRIYSKWKTWVEKPFECPPPPQQSATDETLTNKIPYFLYVSAGNRSHLIIITIIDFSEA